MWIDKTHLRAAAIVAGLTVALCLLRYAYTHNPLSVRCEWACLGYGCAAAVCCGLANSLSLKHVLPAKRFRVSRWQKIHVWGGALSIPLVACHTGWDWGYGWSISYWLAWDYWLIALTGLAALLAQHVFPLKKFGDKGKAATAAQVITGTRETALFFHLPATAGFWPLLLGHVWMHLYW